MHEALDLQRARHLQHNKSSSYISLDDRRGLINTSIHMRFSGEVNDRRAAFHSLRNGSSITNISPNERIIGMIRYGFEICQVSGVGQLVIIYDLVSFIQGEHMADKIRSYESGASGYKNFHRAISWRAPVCAGRFSGILFAPEPATRLLACSNDSKVPASVHQPSIIS